MPQRHDNAHPLWAGPCAAGPLGGITQSMLGRFLGCRERFRLKYVLGLEPPDRWHHTLGYGLMWHHCEEGLARGENWDTFHEYVRGLLNRYPFQQEEITKWGSVCKVQFPEYVKYWREEPDVLCRVPVMQERVFDVPYALPSGRVVRLRGRWDSVDHITDDVTGPGGALYLQENKTKGDINKEQVERQIKFDLQTLFYLTALERERNLFGQSPSDLYQRIGGVRYNVVRRPLSGGKGSIRPHSAKSTKTTYTPAESADDFYERLRRDYLAAEPSYWFFRVRAEISQEDVRVFRDTCLDPILEQVCAWYEEVTGQYEIHLTTTGCVPLPPMNYRTPFGVYNPLDESGATEYDAYLATGSEAGLRRVEELFTELQ